MSFGDELEKKCSNAVKAKREAVKVMAIELFSGVIYRTPIGNQELWKNPTSAPKGYTGGSARSNWFLTFTTPPSKATDSTEREKGTRDSFYAEIASLIDKQRGSTNATQYFLTNNLPYIKKLNENWSSQTQGLGILDPEFSRVNAMIPQIEKAANKKYGVD